MYILIIALIVFLLIIFIILNIINKFNISVNKFNISNNKQCRKYLPKYNPLEWDRKDHNIRKYNNCFAYAFQDLEKNRDHKPQPGELHGIKLKKNSYNCNDLLNAIKVDYPNSYILAKPDENKLFSVKNDNKECKCGYYKTFVAISPKTIKKNEDYHFYRQDNTLLWSHKPGNKDVMNTDGNGNLIKNPLYSDRHVDGHYYSIPCGFICVVGKDK